MMEILRKMIQNFSASTTKKALILAAIAMMTLAACTKFEDTAPPRKITFEIATYRPQTKAVDENAPEGSILREFSEFKCKAFLHAAGYTTETQNMFGAAGETISAYTSENAITTTSAQVAYWAPSHDYYWPKDASSYINFISWYDDKGTVPTTATESELIWQNYTVEEDDNLLYAEEAWHYQATPAAEYQKDGQVSTGVPMLFHHALAKICINAKVAITDADNIVGANEPVNENKKTYWVVTLRDISLSGVHNTGTLSLKNVEPALTDPITPSKVDWTWDGYPTTKLPWTPTGTRTTITMNNVTQPLTENANDRVLLEMRSVMPQAVTDDIVLSLKYNISTRFGATGAAEEEYAKEEIQANIKLNEVSDHIDIWNMNKKITYTVIINPKTTTIKIDPAMVDWINEPGGTATL